MKRKLLLLLSIAALTACATKQYGKVQGLSPSEEMQYKCREIQIEFDKLVQFERQIERTGQFNTKTVLGILGDLGIGNSMAKKDARESALLRRADLEDLAAQRNCNITTTAESQPTTIHKSKVGIVDEGNPEENIDKAEILFWEDVRESGDSEMLKIYLKQYPNGTFAPLAKHKIAKLEPSQNALPPASLPNEVSDFVGIWRAKYSGSDERGGTILLDIKNVNGSTLEGRFTFDGNHKCEQALSGVIEEETISFNSSGSCSIKGNLWIEKNKNGQVKGFRGDVMLNAIPQTLKFRKM